MTLIAVFRPDAPIIMSDVLLSHLAPSKVAFTPTGRFVRPSPQSKQYQPHSFSQKTLLLDEGRAAFVGTGDVGKLKRLATDLRDEIRKGMKADDLEPWSVRKTALCGDNTSIMVSWAQNGQVLNRTTGVGVVSLPLPQGGAVKCGGSGTDWLRRNLIGESASLETVGEFSELEMVLNLAIGHTAQHLSQERFLGMRGSFGGGFQITYFDGDRFVPVPQIVYLVFIVEHRDGGASMSLAGPPVVQRSDGQRLTFQLWIPEKEEFVVSRGRATLETRSRFIETVVPPLIYTRTKPVPVQGLSTGDYVNAQVIHVRGGALIGLGSFQLTGDPNLTGVRLGGEPDEAMTVSIPEAIFETWMTRYTVVPPARPRVAP